MNRGQSDVWRLQPETVRQGKSDTDQGNRAPGGSAGGPGHARTPGGRAVHGSRTGSEVSRPRRQAPRGLINCGALMGPKKEPATMAGSVCIMVGLVMRRAIPRRRVAPSL